MRSSKTKLKASLVAVVLACTVAGPAEAKAPTLYKNCTNFNKKYPHGVGKAKAHDKTSGDPVTAFKRSNAIYATAVKWNKGLDRDHDGIACEKA